MKKLMRLAALGLALMDGAMQQSPETRVINEYGRPYREWMTHGA